MPVDLTDIYDQNVSPTDDPPASQGLDLNSIGVPQGKPSYIGGDVSQLKPEKFTGYLNEPLYEDKGDPYLRRGEAQSGGEKFGNFLVQTGGKFLTQIADMAGGISSLATEWDKDRDYKNGFTEMADQGNAWLDENFPLYRSTEGTWGLGDASWWLQNASGLIASVGGFAVGGTGIAKSLGAIGKGLRIARGAESLLSIAADPIMARAIVQGGERTLTAGMLAYSEGAMSGRRVFDHVYKEQIRQGASEEVATEMASQSAATTVQLNTMLNTGMNLLGGVNMFFNHEKNAVLETAKKNLSRIKGEADTKWIQRLIEATPNKYARELGTNMGLRGMGNKALTATREATAEGIEELTNQFAERTGMEEGEKGKSYGFFEQLGQLSNYLDRTMNEEGALNFAMGAIAGPLQNTLASTIPYHKVVTGEGKTEYMNSIKKNRSITGKFFTDIRDKVLEDAEYLQKTEKEIQQAIVAGKPLQAEKLKNDYFNLMNLNSVSLGMGENVKETYRSIMELDNTKVDTQELQEKLGVIVNNLPTAKGEEVQALNEQKVVLEDALQNSKGKTAAMRLGFASSPQDNAYKERAREAIETLDELQEIHEKVQKRFGIDNDVTSVSEALVADNMFQQMGKAHVLKKEIEKRKKEAAAAGTPIVPGAGIPTPPPPPVDTRTAEQIEKEEEVPPPPPASLLETLPDGIIIPTIEPLPDIDYSELNKSITRMEKELEESEKKLEEDLKPKNLEKAAKETEKQLTQLEKAAVQEQLEKAKNNEALAENKEAAAKALEKEALTPGIELSPGLPPPPPAGLVVDLPVFGLMSNMEPIDTTLPDSDPQGWIGTKQIHPQNSVAAKSTVYLVQKVGSSNVKKSTQILNENVSLQILLPTGLSPKTPLRILVDETYDGTVIDTSAEPTGTAKANKLKLSKFEDFIGPDGKLTTEGIKEVPIKIVTEDGETVGYLHGLDWVLDKTGGNNEQYKNVVDEYLMGTTLITDNARRSAEALLDLRKSIVEQYNRGNKDGVITTVTEKGAGQLVYLKEYQRAHNHLRGPGVQLAYVKDANTLLGTNLTKINTGTEGYAGWENRTIALLPMANKTHTPVALVGTPLADSPDIEEPGSGNETWQTINRVIELHLNADGNKEEIQKVKDWTGFDVGNKEGFRNFMIQYYTYFTPQKQFLESGESGVIIDSIGPVKGTPVITIVEKDNFGLKITDLALEDGVLSRESKAALASLLNVRYKSTALGTKEIKGMNTPGEFRYISFKNKQWKEGKASNYNQYLLSYLLTNVTYAKDPKTNDYSVQYTDDAGRQRTEFIYGVNPIVSFDETPVLEADVKIDTNLPDGKISIDPLPEVEVPAVEGFDFDFFGQTLSNPEPIKSVGTTTKPPINLESLEKLFTFTPLEDRNNKSPQEVLDYLRNIQVTHIPEGYNPFRKCK